MIIMQTLNIISNSKEIRPMLRYFNICYYLSGFFQYKIWAVFPDIAKLVTYYQKEIPGISQHRSDLLSVRNYILWP